MSARTDAPAGGPRRALWPMAAVTRRTGLGPHTLRAWERRFGFPLPVRLPSGHRRYSEDQIDRLHLIVQALALGHRAGDVVPLGSDQLQALVGTPPADTERLPAWEACIIDKARAFDREGIVSDLAHAYASLGVRTFLRERLVPLTVEVGSVWAAGDLEIRHEHFLTEILEDTLRILRTPLEHGSQGRPLLLATLPGERHGLGMQIAGLVSALAGRRVRLLGPEMPVGEIVRAAEGLDPIAVGVSVTQHTALRATTKGINTLRASLDDGVAVWVGGAGARAADRPAAADHPSRDARRARARAAPGRLPGPGPPAVLNSRNAHRCRASRGGQALPAGR